MQTKSRGSLFSFIYRQKPSISKNLAFSLSFIVFLVLFALLGILYIKYSMDMIRDLEKKADEHISRITGILTESVWNLDEKSIIGISTEFAHSELVNSIRIIDIEGAVLFEFKNPPDGFLKISRTGKIIYKDNVIGFAEISLSLKKYKKDLSQIFKVTALIFTGSALVLYLATGILLRVFLRKPLNDLYQGMIQIARGNFTHNFKYAKHKELSGIMQNFLIMKQMVKDRESAFISANTMLKQEIAEKKQSEEALRESESKFKNLFELSPQSIFLEEVETGLIVDVNMEFCKLTQFKSNELISKSSEDLKIFSKSDKETLISALKQSAEVRGMEIDFMVKDTSKGRAMISAKLIQLKGKLLILSVLLDITEYKKALKEKEELQERLARSTKMEALGLLAGGVAHDLNNILSGIVSYPDLLLMDIPKESKLRKPIETIKSSGQRAAAVVSDLLTLARGIASTKETMNLNHILDEYLQSPEFHDIKSLHPNVRITVLPRSDLLNISCSSIHIKKVLMNLVNNAVEAIDNSGEVIISTSNRYIDQPVKGYDEVRTGEYAVLSVKDTGSGISPDNLKRIFEPFYTKKVMGRSGTGLGLAVVWNTIKEHDGYIDVASSSKGSVFELYFPIVRKEIFNIKNHVAVEDYSGNGEKILVIDDEQHQQMIACGLLTRLGYDAKAVGSGYQAIEYLEKHDVDLILLDMIMPEMNGSETYARIVKNKPGQKALITSGFAETSDVKKAQKMGAGPYIKKPYTLEKLAVTIKIELEKQSV
ncbi:Two component system sensor histidine kinase, PAS domain-containing [Desulfonema limicola]|uniref:histidine kinase n=1 Tax=Desulfonema limicola TaxID=45656 RepID=A0A975GKN7_9BACT|nr:response regulator [Desulfonema limicola]QTA83983.1 Two component system sensor histidine kinase, PAS domain-containing [Desulfonema limicola]